MALWKRMTLALGLAGLSVAAAWTAAAMVAPAPRATHVAGMPAGGSLTAVPLDRLPAITDAAVVARVAEVGQVRLSTADGAFPDIDPAAGPVRLTGLFTVTPVELEIVEVVAARSGMSPEAAALVGQLAPGDRLDLTVAGGVFTHVVSPGEARALGIEVVPDGAADESVEEYPDEPVEVHSGTGTSVALTEGDEALLFLATKTHPEMGSFVHLAGSGQGAFVLDGATATQALPGAAGLTLPAADVRAVAALVAAEAGPSQDVDDLYGG